MAFFDKIGDKAKGLVDSAKITYKVSEEKSKLSELYEHLGLLVWEAHQNDAEPPAELVPVFDRSISSLDKYIEAVDGTIKCPSCGRQIDKLSAFCPCCGNKLSSDDSAKPDCSAKRYCAACGSELNSAAAFCPHCGAKN